jgi:anaerobic selenocysteine-containing dehydrogenase
MKESKDVEPPSSRRDFLKASTLAAAAATVAAAYFKDVLQAVAAGTERQSYSRLRTRRQICGSRRRLDAVRA